MTCHASSLSITSPCVFVTDKTFALVNVKFPGVQLQHQVALSVELHFQFPSLAPQWDRNKHVALTIQQTVNTPLRTTL